MPNIFCFGIKVREKVHKVLPAIIMEVLDFYFLNPIFRAQDLLKSKCVLC